MAVYTHSSFRNIRFDKKSGEAISEVKVRSLRGVYPDLSGKQSSDFQNKFEITSPDIRRDRDASAPFETASFTNFRNPLYFIQYQVICGGSLSAQDDS